jgi:hypothetical protein
MRQCSRCGQEIPESATACSYCRSESDWFVHKLPPLGATADQPTSPTAASPQPATTTPASAQPATTTPASPVDQPSPLAAVSLSPRRVAAIAIAVIGGAVMAAMVFRLVSSSRESAGVKAATVHAATSARSGATTAAPNITPKWRSANPDWLGNDPRAVAFEVLSENRVQIWQRQAHPSLVVRCSSKEIEVFVFIESAARIEAQDENHTVRLTFDNEPEVTERWPDSYQHNALFAPDGAAFTGRLTHASTLKFGYTPHNAGRVVAEFHVSGLADRLDSVARQCGLKK